MGTCRPPQSTTLIGGYVSDRVSRGTVYKYIAAADLSPEPPVGSRRGRILIKELTDRLLEMCEEL